MATGTDPRISANIEFADGLRALADFYERHPTLKPLGNQRLLNYVGLTDDPRAELAAFARASRRAEKYGDDNYFGLRLNFGGGVILCVYAGREQTCTRVVKGTREVTTLVPAADAPMVEVTETVEDVEWVCEPLLAPTGSIIPPALVPVGHEDYPEEIG